MNKYIIVKHDYLDYDGSYDAANNWDAKDNNLVEEVNKYINQGYEPVGVPFTIKQGNSEKWCLTMIK